MGIHDILISLVEPEACADAIVIGPHLTVVRSGDRCGLSSTIRSGNRPHTGPEVSAPGELAGRPLIELARMVQSKLALEASVGMAAINAGLPASGVNYTEANGLDLLMDMARGRHLAMVGHFSFTEKLRKVAGALSVLELDPAEGDLPASQAGSVIPAADVVAITGSAFANRTIEDLLELASDKWTMVLGPTTPLTPVLFDYGVDAIAGSLVEDADLTMRQVMEGGIFKQLGGVRRVTLLR